MNKNILAIGITILFAISAFTPMSLGYNYNTNGLVIESSINTQSIKLPDKETKNISTNISYFPIKLNDTISETDTSNNLSQNLHNIEFITGEMIVKFNENIDISPKIIENHVEIGIKSIDKLNKKHNVKSIERVYRWKKSSFSNTYKFTLPEYCVIPLVAEEFSRNQNVIYAEPNYIYHSLVIPDDPYFDMQWALNQDSDCDIDAPESWDIETGDENIVIAIQDTGVDWDHPDLRDNIWINTGEDLNGNGIVDPSDFNDIDDDNNGFIDDIRGYDFVNTTNAVAPGEDGTIPDNNPMDFHGHGTHCSGIASAVTDNNIGIAGVCWNCRIMPVRIGYKGVFGTAYMEADDCAYGIVYAADNGADVISMSWGGNSESQLIEDAIDYAYNKGVVLVAAAGNDNINLDNYPLPFFPAEYDNVIAVAATDSSDKRAQFSNYGFQVDVAAPGVNILSTFLNNSYKKANGTSMSCPHVAGLTALILSKIPNLNPMEIRTILHSSTDTINTDKYVRFGRINAYTALQKTAPVIVNIDTPKVNTEVKGIIEIIGTAKGEQFQQYTVEYGKGIAPDSWVLIKNSDIPVDNNKLGLWDTTIVNEGVYTIRVILNNNDTTYIDKTWVMVNNFHNTIFTDDENTEGPWDGTEEFPYQYIQEAVDDAGTGDTVYISTGLYSEDIMVYTQIDIVGEEKEKTIIESSKICCITIFADGVNVSRLTLISRGYCLEIFSNNNTIKDNIIKSFLMPHISLGIVIQPFLFYVGYARGDGIINFAPTIHGNTITGNEIIKHYMGISLLSACENSIYHNNFIENLIPAYYRYRSYSFIDFEYQFYYKYRPPSYKNHWYENFWDDWYGLKKGLFKGFPKIIKGEIFKELWIFFSEDRAFHRISFNKWFNFDWHPLSEPYDTHGGV